MTDEKLKMVKKTGRCTHPPAGRQVKGEWVVVCQGCGKMISSNDPDEGVEFTVTKRVPFLLPFLLKKQHSPQNP